MEKKTKQENTSYMVNESEFKKVLKKIFQAPSTKTPAKKKTKAKKR